MKRILLNILSIVSVVLMTTSCEDMFGDFLEKAPGADVTEDNVFSSQAELDIYLAACYEQAIYDPFEEESHLLGSDKQSNDLADNLIYYSSISDEGKHGAAWWPANIVNLGTLTNTNTFFDFSFKQRFAGLRMVNTLIERVDEVPDASDEYKAQVKAEAYHLRAELHFIFFKKYGGTSLITKRFAPTELEEMHVPRSSVDSTVQLIVNDLDKAIPNLPDVYASSMRGRITKGAAMALKSRVLLYAASPLYNTATPPLDMANLADNRLICYGNYDKNRWQKAADAAKAVLDWAPAGGVHLITDQGVDKNYRYVWEQPDNAEVILSNKHGGDNFRIQNTVKKKSALRFYLCKPVGGFNPGLETTQNFVELYEKRDGTPMVWPDTDNNLSERYAELDYRFHQTVGYNGFYYTKKKGNLAFYQGGAHKNGLNYGYVVKKWIPDYIKNPNTKYDIDVPRYRLAEFYLNYAEALNEAQGPVSDAYDAVNTIRDRSGMPPLPSGLSQEEFRERVRNERAVELAFEEHRWWDLRRWRTAETVLNAPFYGINIYKNTPETNPLTFNYVKFSFETRVFKPEYYHGFYFQNELNKGYLVQNPGW